jgi:hypothetical protein
MHRLVGSQAASDLGELAIAERRNDAEIRVCRAQLEALCEREHVALRLDSSDVELRALHVCVHSLLRDRRAAQLAHSAGKRIAMRLVMALKQHGDGQHFLREQAALGTDLIRGDRFVLESERDVEDAAVLGCIGVRVVGERVVAGEQGDRTCRQRELARVGEQRASGDRA